MYRFQRARFVLYSSVLHPSWFPRCARFNGVEERKGFLYQDDFVACADLAASVRPLPPHPSFVLCSAGMIVDLQPPPTHTHALTHSHTHVHTHTHTHFCSLTQPLVIAGIHELNEWMNGKMDGRIDSPF